MALNLNLTRNSAIADKPRDAFNGQFKYPWYINFVPKFLERI